MASKQKEAPKPPAPTPPADNAAALKQATTDARIAVLEEELLNKEDQIEALNRTVAKMSKGTDDKPPAFKSIKPVVLGKVAYGFAMGAIRYKGKRYTAQDVSENLDLAAELVALGSGMLVEQ